MKILVLAEEVKLGKYVTERNSLEDIFTVTVADPKKLNEYLDDGYEIISKKRKRLSATLPDEHSHLVKLED